MPDRLWPDVPETDRPPAWPADGDPDGSPRVDVFPVVIDEYDHHEPLEAKGEAQALAVMLADFGGVEMPWATPSSDRGGDAVAGRLLEWAYPIDPSNTILYWVSHGWSDGLDVALAHARSPRSVRVFGVLPHQLAESVRTRQTTSDGRWAMVIIETCWSSKFVDKVNAMLADGPVGADAVMLVGVSGDGAVALGRFRAALHACLQENFRSNRRIELWRLIGELDRRLADGLVIGRRLGEAALYRATTPIAATMSIPLDILQLLEEVVNRLSNDERRHFLAKAQAAEEGEISWFFQGRERETAALSSWLRGTRSGMFIVTGPAGSGKSALLGHVLVHSLPDLRDALVQADLVEPLRAAEGPPEHAFDLVVHLAGISVSAFIRRVALAADLGTPAGEAQGDVIMHVAGDIDWLIKSMAARAGRFTMLLDALDEAQDPLALAGSLIRPLTRLENVRVVIGTRGSTSESPDFPAGGDTDLLESLGFATALSAGAVLTVERDDDAVARYVARRLTVARAQDNALSHLDDRLLQDVAVLIAGRQRHFLFARLAVYELIARPELFVPDRRRDLEGLLNGDHRDLFAAAVGRLSARSAQSLKLFRALALARGRGTPIRDGIWTAMANALGESTEPVTDQDITELLRNAQPYIAIDEQQDTTVYRLAHRTFVEHFLAIWINDV